jgi:hypothetical protein
LGEGTVTLLDDLLKIRVCPKCSVAKPLSVDYFYIARPRGKHKTPGWQSYCKDCWKEINAENKMRRKISEYLNNGFR